MHIPLGSIPLVLIMLGVVYFIFPTPYDCLYVFLHIKVFLHLKEEQEKIMVKRYGKPEEVAYLVKFLISDEANFINNSIIRIDGGQIGSM